MRHNGLYQELMQEFNFSDSSVGMMPISYRDETAIKEVLEEFNLTPVGYYETRNSEGYEFSDGKTSYSLQFDGCKFQIYELIKF